MLNTSDPKLFELIQNEEKRQNETISLIPSENEAYPEVLEILEVV